MWRSLLFIPLLEERFIAKAAERQADAIVLDLEAGVANHRKGEARETLPDVISQLSSKVEVTVRINPLWVEAMRDLEAGIIEGVSSVHLARCQSPEQVAAVDGIVSELEVERGLAPGSIQLVPMLESPGAVLQAAAIASAADRVAGLTLGVEDYALEMGVDASDTLLQPAAHQVIQAARAAGVAALVVPTSMSSFRDLATLEKAATLARAWGSCGGYAIHPDQVSILNKVFAPKPEELEWAQKVTSAADAAASQGKGVFLVDGNMIDLPLIKRARQILKYGEIR